MTPTHPGARTILCAIDFSAPSRRALEQAIALSDRTKARLELVHVCEPWVVGMAPELAGDSTALDDEVLRVAEQRMRAQIDAVRARHADVGGIVLRGFAANGIVARAEDTRADLVVLATTGHGAIAHAILGSVADRVLRTTTRPVLLVPGDAREVSLVPRRLVVPSDFSETAHAALRWALAFANEVGATVEVLHAYDVDPHLAPTPRLADELRKAARENVEREMSALGGVVARAVEGTAPRAIAGATESGDVDMIVIGSTGRGAISAMLGGVTDKVVRAARVPVLVVRGPVATIGASRFGA